MCLPEFEASFDRYATFPYSVYMTSMVWQPLGAITSFLVAIWLYKGFTDADSVLAFDNTQEHQDVDAEDLEEKRETLASRLSHYACAAVARSTEVLRTNHNLLTR